MPICVPIKDMKDTASFAHLVENSAEPVIVTKNGYDQFVVLRCKDYDELRKAEARASLMERLAIAERERAEGKTADGHDVIASIRPRHGL